MNTNKLRPCKVGEELYLFHGFTQISQIVPPSLIPRHGKGVCQIRRGGDKRCLTTRESTRTTLASGIRK